MHPTSITIRVAILSDELLGWGSGKHYFQAILDRYSWTNQKSYQFHATYVTDQDILDGVLHPRDFDVLLVPGGGVGDGHSLVKGFHRLRKNKKWKKQIASFIQEGGGYVGICGGAALMTSLITEDDGFTDTFLERLYDTSSIGVSCVQSFYRHLATPLFYLFQYKHPEKVGAASHVFSFAPGKTTDAQKVFSAGIPVDCSIDPSHPIFSCHKEKTLRMRWWGGPAFLIPKNPDRQVEIIARYPKDDFSQNQKTKIYAWRYTGGIWGLFRALKKAAYYIKTHQKDLKQLFLYAYYFAGDWEQTPLVINLDFSSKSCMTTEVFPNEHQARIILCGTHPEYMIWWDGRIQEVNKDGFHCIGTGFHQWKDITFHSSDVKKELTHTWWLVRRMVAWAAKIPDEHLPLTENNDEIIQKDILPSKEVYWDGTLEHQLQKI